MTTLWIDNRRCDICQLPAIPIGFDIDNLTKVEGAREGRCIEIVLPFTDANNAIFGSSCDLYATKKFNMEHHIACIEQDGVEILRGTAYLLTSTISPKQSCSYSIRIKEGGAEWIKSVIYGYLSDLKIPFSNSLNLSTIQSSWGTDASVHFLPVYRGNFTPHYSTSSALPAERVLLTDDYHPFISVADMVKAMFEDSGYTLRSSFLDSSFGRSLCMSGDYARTENSTAKVRCDFFARRASAGEATADLAGRVYASNLFAANTVGAIVDTANPTAIDSNGEIMSDTFCKEGSFSKNSIGDICFTPKVSAKVGFLLHLEYTTDYKIKSREQFTGFDTIEGLNNERVEVALANTCQDFRNNLSTNMEYRVVVFDHVDGREYQLSATQVDNTIRALKTWSARSALATTPSVALSSLKIFYRDSDDDSAWSLYTGDWAMYAGHIEEEGRVDIELDFRIAPQEVYAGESLALNKFWFGGAEQGMKITIGTGTSLRPYFTDTPGYNSSINFKDIAPRNIRQSELLTAIGEMFNLGFYTDLHRKEVVIEPLEWLYEVGEVVDWSDRVDWSKGVTITDSGLGLSQDFVLRYLNNDKASHTFNTSNNTTLGYWRFRNPLYGTKQHSRELTSPIFTTTLNISDIIGSAPSASIVQVGDTGAEEGFDAVFTPHIVCYKGMLSLPEGESWGVTSRLGSYPYATFLDNETNLCFESRNGVEGLHRYYLPMLHRQRDSQQITLCLRLSTAEIATLFTADGAKPSMRSRFRFDILGESSIFRLVKMEQWELERGVIRCTFERELND